jgi:hypothetical protein
MRASSMSLDESAERGTKAMKALVFPIGAMLVGCAALNAVWYKPGGTQQEFARDRYECMASSQMSVSQAAVNGSATPAYGSVNGAASSYTTTNEPLFSACMQARGYVWTNQATVQKYEASQSNYQPAGSAPERPAVVSTQSAKSAASEKAYEECMKRYNWADSADAKCQRDTQ